MIILFALISLPIFSYASPKVYLNESGPNSTSSNLTFLLSQNLTIDNNLNHTFEGRSTGNNANWDVEYMASNTTGFLLRLRIDDEAGTLDDKILSIDCIDTSKTPTVICGPDCGGLDFSQFHNFTLLFNSTSLTAKISVDGVSRADIDICTNATQIGNVRFSRSAGTSYEVKNNLLTASNLKPTLVSSIPNVTLPEDTSTNFSISGSFSDPNGDALTFGLKELVDNLTINVSQNGSVNITANPNFNGIRYAIFLANDSENITYSNNVTINVTPVNDAPTISGLTLNNTDFLNRTNGSLIVGWTFSDIDGDLQQGNETLWYINGTEKIEFRNFTSINSTNTTKTQNWTFSVRVFDGANFSSFANSTYLLIANSAPAHSTPTVTSNDGQNRKNGTLTCNNQSTNDLDLDLVTNFIKWFNNSRLVDTSINSATLSVRNYS